MTNDKPLDKMGAMPNLQKITPCLWFNNQAEAAARFYTGIFDNSKIIRINHYDAAGAAISGQAEGSVLTVVFELDGQEFTALNGGPQFTFSEAVSFVVHCDSQEEVDYFWHKLTEGGEESQCGWLKDRFGVSWQVVPSALFDMISDPDAAKSQNVMKTLLQMQKIDLATLKRAYEQS